MPSASATTPSSSPFPTTARVPWAGRTGPTTINAAGSDFAPAWRRTWRVSTTWAGRSPTTTTRSAGRWPATRRSSATRATPTAAACGAAPADPLAGRHPGQGPDAQAVLPRGGHHADATGRARRAVADAGRRCRADSPARRVHGPHLQRQRRGHAQDRPIFRDGRPARHLARGLEGRHVPPARNGLRRGRVGALQPRRGPGGKSTIWPSGIRQSSPRSRTSGGGRPNGMACCLWTM